MKKIKIFWIISLSFVFFSLISVLFQFFIIRQTFTDFYYKEKEQELLEKSLLIKHDLIQQIILKNQNEIQKITSNFSKNANTRLTLILPNGKVASDSDKSLDLMDNHKERPEIKSALKGKLGTSIRFSDTLNQNYFYLALPLIENDSLIGVLRLSIPVSNLKTSLNELTSNFMIESFGVIFILIIIFIFYSKSLSLPLEKMRVITEKIAMGNFSEKIKVRQTDSQEIYSLGKSLNKMTDQLKEQINKIIKQKNEQEAVFLSMTEGVLSIDINKKIFQINNSAKKLFNLDIKNNYLGIPLKEVIRTQKIDDFFNEIIETKDFLEKELELSEHQIFQVHGSILFGEKNNITGILLVFNDISNLRKLEQYRRDFVTNVSHELKTPLTSINGYLENLIDGEVDSQETRLKFLKIVQKHALKLQKIIEDLLILSNIENETQDEHFSEIFEIFPILSAAKSLFHENSENIVIKCEKGLQGKVNPHLLEIALTNLLQNAIKYGAKNSPIILSAKLSKQYIEFSVEDHGPGIPLEHHSRLFERFYCVDKSRSKDIGGSGLGLSIVKHIAMAHKGHVQVESTVDKGSIFTIFIPRT